MDDAGVEQGGDGPSLPTSIWVLAWASLAGQGVALLQRGLRSDEVSVAVSIVLGALIVGYVSAGVVRARTVRLVLAWVVLALGLVGELVSFFFVDDPGDALLVLSALVVSTLSLGALARFRRSDWYAWQRTKPPARQGAPIGQLVAIGVLVGALGGIVQPVDNGLHADIRVADG